MLFIGSENPLFPLWTEMAEGAGFEPARPFGLPVFKTGAINRSATPPKCIHRSAGKFLFAALVTSVNAREFYQTDASRQDANGSLPLQK